MKNHEYGNAQICLSGHIVCPDISVFPEKVSAFCPGCGSETISECPSCHAPIRGTHYLVSPKYRLVQRGSLFSDNISSTSEIFGFDKRPDERLKVPAYCYKCGSPYPWTSRLLETADHITDLMEELSEVQKAQLKECFPNLLSNSVEAPYSALLASKLISLASSVAQGALRNLLENFLAESVILLLGWKD